MTLNQRRRTLFVASGLEPTPVHGTWDDLYRTITAGTYATDYSIGDVLPLDLGSQGVVNAVIVGFNKDDKADDSGKAPISFVAQYLLATNQRFNPQRAGSSGNYTDGTGTIGGWGSSEIRTYVQSTIKALFPANVLSHIVSVKKYSMIYNTAGSKVSNDETSDDVWIPSYYEMNNRTGYESSGPHYSPFSSDASRIKNKGETATKYWLRSAGTSTNNPCVVTNTGSISGGNTTAQTATAILIGFCIG